MKKKYNFLKFGGGFIGAVSYWMLYTMTINSETFSFLRAPINFIVDIYVQNHPCTSTEAWGCLGYNQGIGLFVAPILGFIIGYIIELIIRKNKWFGLK